MSEKRFISKSNYDWWYIKDTAGEFKGRYSDWMSEDEVVNLLNQLINENEQLKQKVDFYKYFQKDARELEKENEQLKQQFLKILKKLDKKIDNLKILYGDSL